MKVRPRGLASLCVGLLILVAVRVATGSDAPAAPAEVRINNVWTESDLRAVLGDIAQQSGVNILVEPSVQGSITFQAKDLPLGKCLEAVLAPGGHAYARVDDYYVVGSTDPASPTFALLSTTHTIVLKHTDARDLQSLLPKCLARYVQVGSSKSVVTVTAPNGLLPKVLEAVRGIDVPPKQVLIEAIVTELAENAGKELGLSWQWDWDTSTLKPDPASPTVEGTKGQSTASGTVDMLRANGYFPGSISYATTGGFTRLFKLNLQLLVNEGRAKIRANPRIMAINGTTAEIYVGREQYFAFLVDANELLRAGVKNISSYTVKQINSGVTLRVTPRVADEGVITVELAPEVSEVIGMSEQGLPILNKRTSKTTVMVKSGEPIVIGGLTQETEQITTKKVPFLGDIPLLGWFFKTVVRQTAQKEVIIVITPRLVSDEAVARKEPKNDHATEERIAGMAADITAGNVAGIRARLADLDERLHRAGTP